MKAIVVAGMALLLSACGPAAPPDLPKDGIVAVGSGGEDMFGGKDQLAGQLKLESGCVTVVPDDGAPVVPVFRSGAAEVDGELTELRWKGKPFADGEPVVFEGDELGSFTNLPDWVEGYYIPGGCPKFDRAFLVNHYPE